MVCRFVRGVKAAVAFPILLCLAGAVGAQEIQLSNFGEMPPVILHHGKHAESFTCETCHHPERSGGSHRCGYCHRDEARGKVVSFQDAAHKEGVGRCWGCHFKETATKKLACEACHRGKARAPSPRTP